jgi:hypothetical protein
MTAGAAAAGLVVLGVPVATLALSGAPGGAPPGRAPANVPEQPVQIQVGRHSDLQPRASGSPPPPPPRPPPPPPPAAAAAR